jgi:hypothetical protein
MIFNQHLFLKELLHRTINVNFNSKDFSANFYEADLLELNKVLLNTQTKYPLIWLETGYREQHRLQGGELKLAKCNFIFVTKGDKTDYFSKRYETSFNEILYPLFSKFEEKINQTHGISFETEYHEIISLPFNDVTELSAKTRSVDGVSKSAKQSQPLIDIWDALILTTDISINTDCHPQFKIKK